MNLLSESIIVTAFITFALSGLFSVLVLHFFARWRIVDRPHLYGLKRKPIPLPGGVAPVAAFLLALLLFFPFDVKIIGLFFGLLLIAIISFLDDRYHLAPLLRLAVHLVAAAIVAYAGIRIEYLGNPFGATLELTEIFFLLPHFITIVWLVGFANVLNWLDGVPGLSAASAASAGIFLGILSVSAVVDQPQTALLSLIFAASALGFVLFNLPPPKMLLGDTGAMVFGFTLASISVFSGGKMATAFIVLALPLLDAAYVLTRRILSGKNPLKGKDNLHLHDRLAELGLADREILLIFLVLSILLGYLSLQLQTVGKAVLIASVALLFLLISYLIEKILARQSLLTK
jgi:UDP-GlcNAc:undecaprenyl-phosphate GlcNAc-1-phosphate transferase